MTDTIKMMDDKIIELMLTSNTIEQWNENRESIKGLRDLTWIGVNIDSGLINKTKIANKKIEKI